MAEFISSLIEYLQISAITDLFITIKTENKYFFSLAQTLPLRTNPHNPSGSMFTDLFQGVLDANVFFLSPGEGSTRFYTD